MTRRHAVAYLRVSSIKDQTRAISPEQQEEAVRKLAAQHDDSPSKLVILKDWSRSGGKRLSDRGAGSRELVRMIEADEVRSLYCYSSSRLGRNLSEALHLIDLADTHGVERIWSFKDGDLNPKTASGKFQRNVLASADQMYRDEAVERGQANYEHRVERGDHVGTAPYGQMIDRATHKAVPNPREDVSAVMEAYERAGGNFKKAAQYLSSMPDLVSRSKPRRAGFWVPTTVARIVRREMAERGTPIPTRGPVSEGPKAVKDYVLYRLLRCPHEGNRLTAQRSTSGNGGKFVRYVCRTGTHDPQHPKPYSVAESIVLPWLVGQLEAEGFDRIETRRTRIGGVEQTRDELEEDRRRAGVTYRAKAMTDEEFEAEVRRIDRAIESLADDGDVPGAFQWLVANIALNVENLQRDPANSNRRLRNTIDLVELDAQMRPTKVIWR